MNWKDQERIKISIPKEHLSQVFSRNFEEGIEDVLESELFISTTEKERPRLRIFYEPSRRYDEYFYSLFQGGFNLLNYLSTDIEEQDNIYEFSNSKVVEYIRSRGYWEQGNTYFELVLDKLTTRTHNRSSNTHAILNFDSTSHHIIDNVYKYEVFDFDNENKFEAVPKEYTSTTHFGEFEVSILPEFETRYENLNSFIVKRYARIELNKLYIEKYDNFEEIRKESQLIVSILSLYFDFTIDIIYARYHMESITTIEIQNDGLDNGLIKGDTVFQEDYDTVLSFIGEIDRYGISGYEDFVNGIISQYLFSRRLNGEARFMILYNVLEQFRNFYIKKFKPEEYSDHREDYKTVGSRKSIRKHIKKSIESIVEVIHEDDKEQFTENISNKISFMTKKQMNHQISSFLDSLSIEYESELLLGLLRLRNKVYHGSIAVEKRDEVYIAISNLEEIVIRLFKSLLKI